MSFNRSTAIRSALVGVMITTLITPAAPARAQAPTHSVTQISDLSTLDLEQLMKLEVVFAASKRAQNTRDVASFVTVVTAKEILEHGYRTIADVLKSVPSFYVTDDRAYSYVGVRGVGRPGDYNARVLLLLNGLTTNDNVVDQAYIGQEFVVDVDVIERIEVIRGPSAAIYGSNAVFAIINVVTKQGSDVNGLDVSTSAASFGTYGGRVTYGKRLPKDADVLVSATYSDSKGQRLYYPEYDSPATNNGFADAGDYERYLKLLATMTWGNFSLQASTSSRDKGIPTGEFNTVFNDPRTHVMDELSFASLTYGRALANGTSFSTRLYAGSMKDSGEYSHGASILPRVDQSIGAWWGADVDATHTLFSRHVLTVGAEYRDNFEQAQINFDQEPYTLRRDRKNQSVRFGLFAQDEVKLLDGLTLSGGLRYDHYDTFGAMMSPRVGLIYNPGKATTLKLMLGQAFRAPNVFELYDYGKNPDLQPERIETLELIAQRLIGGRVLLTAAAFRNRLSALIEASPEIDDVFENRGEIQSHGAELGLEMNRGHGITGQLTYSLQRSEDRATGIELTNSPRQMVKTQLRIPLAIHDLTLGADAQYMSAAKTMAGLSAKSYVVTNLSLLAPHVADRMELSATVYNLFDARYANPVSDTNRQDALQQNGRNFRVKTTFRF